MEAQLVRRIGIPFKTIPAAGVHGIGLRSLPKNLWRLGRGIFTSQRILREFKPDVLFFTGGYIAVPMAVAGWKIPSLLYVPDIEPGLALKTLSRFADKIAITAIDSVRYFRNKGFSRKKNYSEHLVLTGYPTRSELAGWTRQSARETLKLNDQSPVLLVFGGSKGARSINNAIQADLSDLLKIAQVVHITGELDWEAVSEETTRETVEHAENYHIFPYLHEKMGAALAAADLVISRAGASCLGEFPLFGLPAILVPYPHAWRYQKVNAEFLAKHGGAIIIEDEKLLNQLLGTVKRLLSHPNELASMRESMKRLSHPNASSEIGRHLFSLSLKMEMRP